MTDEKKFQEVVKSQGMYKNGYFGLYLMDEQIDFLIEYVWELREQAERVQGLESLYRIEKGCSLDLLVRNKRMHKALSHIQSEVLKVAPSDLLLEIYDATREGLGEA